MSAQLAWRLLIVTLVRDGVGRCAQRTGSSGGLGPCAHLADGVASSQMADLLRGRQMVCEVGLRRSANSVLAAGLWARVMFSSSKRRVDASRRYRRSSARSFGVSPALRQGQKLDQLGLNGIPPVGCAVDRRGATPRPAGATRTGGCEVGRRMRGRPGRARTAAGHGAAGSRRAPTHPVAPVPDHLKAVGHAATGWGGSCRTMSGGRPGPARPQASGPAPSLASAAGPRRACGSRVAPRRSRSRAPPEDAI